jgi:hypothetical protein
MASTATMMQELHELRNLDAKLDLIWNQLSEERNTSPPAADPIQLENNEDAVINKTSSIGTCMKPPLK